jgi:nucleoside-diphosphate-sugar epimerase
MKFIVVGGAGFLGHNVVQQAESLGHECFIIDNLYNYNFIPHDDLKYLAHERKNQMRSNVHHIDIQDKRHLDSFFLSFAGNVSAVIYLADFPNSAVVNSNPALAASLMPANLIRLLELTKAHSIPKFVYISSDAVYGSSADNLEESLVCCPKNHYGILKLAGEQLVKHYTNSFDHVILRPSTIYGNYGTEQQLVIKFILSAVRGQSIKVNSSSVDLVHVEDVARGIIGATLGKNSVNNTYNIAKSQSFSLADAANLAVSVVGQGSVNVVEGIADNSTGSLSITKAVEDFGYSPQVDVDRGFQECFNWVKSSPIWKAKS